METAAGEMQPHAVRRVLAPFAIWVVAGLLAVWYARSHPTGCADLRWRVYTAGGSSEIDAAVASCDPTLESGARGELILLGLIFVALMFLLAAVLHPLWKSSWRALPFREWRWVGLLPALAGGLGLGATITFVIGSESSPVLRVDDWAAGAMASFAWPAAIIAMLSTVAAGFSMLATIGSAGISQHPAEGVPWQPDPVGGLGVCVSGGGIRAAAFALGGLAHLERHRLDGEPVEDGEKGVLDSAKYLASVSGGGYAAGAWRIARGTKDHAESWPHGVFGDLDASSMSAKDLPDRAFDEPTGDERGLFAHMWARREFLRTGRGGLFVSAVMFGVTVVLQLALIGLGVALIAWPLGMLARSWPILGPTFYGNDPYRFAVEQRSVTPVLAIGVAGAAVLVVRSFMHRTKLRLALDAMVAVLVGSTVAIAAVLLGLPLAVEAVADLDKVGATLASLFAAGGVAMAAAKVLASTLGPRLIRLGGVLFGLAAAVFGLMVTRAAAVPGGALVDDTAWYWLLLVVFVIAWSFGDPRWWSLFPMYRNRIRSAFAVTRQPDLAASRHPVSPNLYPMGRSREPTLDMYAEAPGPKHLVCCSVARTSRTSTGVPALSFVFGPDDVRMYESVSGAEIKLHSIPTKRYVEALERRVLTGLPARRRQSLGTVSAAVAMSGAAVTSSMGRSNVGSTNSLIAGLNVRLGAWVPNPRHVVLDDRPAKRARVNYLVKELFGWYDLDDPHVYVTDGGHWDNLGLVELLRRRCETIVCIDTSGDVPGSFSTLYQALDLALVECRARIDFSKSKSFVDMRADLPLRPLTSSIVGTITYCDDDDNEVGTGRVLFVKAQISGDLTTSVMAYSFEDPLFPNYSTADQFLGADQFRMMVRLGWESMAKGLKKLSVVDPPAEPGAGDDDGNDDGEVAES